MRKARRDSAIVGEVTAGIRPMLGWIIYDMPLMMPLPGARALTLMLLICAAVGGLSKSVGGLTTRAPTELRVHAGTHDRRHTLVPVDSDWKPAAVPHELRDDNGAVGVPLQIDRDGQGWFVLPALDAAAERVFTIVARQAPPAPIVTTNTKEGDIAVAIDGQAVLTYVGGPGLSPGQRHQAGLSTRRISPSCPDAVGPHCH